MFKADMEIKMFAQKVRGDCGQRPSLVQLLPLPKTKTLVVTAIVLLSVVAFCEIKTSLRQAATSENFLEAAQTIFKNNCGLLHPEPLGQVKDYPAIVQPSDDNLQRYNILVAAGMLTRPSDNIYDLTPTGKRWFRQHKPGSRLAGFCAYHLEVREINAFSEPEEQHSHIIRNVTFTYRKKYEDWAKQALIQNAFHEHFDAGEYKTITMPMVLLRNGWDFEDRVF